MTDWEGQVIAAAVRELLAAFRSLARDGFGRRDRALLSAVIRDLLSADPNITRDEATLKAIEAIGAKPSADYYIAKDMLAAVKKRHSIESGEKPSAVKKTEAPAPSTRHRKKK
jgi:hypothetical protein